PDENDIMMIIEPSLNPGERRHILVTHDESIFYSNDGKIFFWGPKGYMPLRKKANELMTKPGIEGLEWVIDGWQKYLDLTVLSDDDSTIKSDDDDDIVDITKNISIQDNNHLIGL
ncbi:5167_t:CDS:2, partial [Entrophospora sp. SA101]